MWLRRMTRRQKRAILYSILLCLVIGSWIIIDHELSRNHYLSTDLIDLPYDIEASEPKLLSQNEIQAMCRANGFVPENARRITKKIFDLVLMSNELDWLEIRLHTLSHYVDYFVIIESPTTFTGRSKPLYLREHWDRFRDFHHMIIYHIVEDNIQSPRIWDHEDYFRNALFNAVFPSLMNTTRHANTGDVLIVSDMDELLRPGVMVLLRHCRVPTRLTLRTQFYYYSFQWRHRGLQWAHPDATLYRDSSDIMPNDLRQGLLGNEWRPIAAVRRWWDRGTLWNAGWHCSSCFATIAEMRTKMDSFSHQGWNTAENRDLHTLLDRVRHGLDLFGRTNELYDKIEDNKDVPAYVSEQYEQKDRFRYLMDRDREDAGFDDISISTLSE